MGNEDKIFCFQGLRLKRKKKQFAEVYISLVSYIMNSESFMLYSCEHRKQGSLYKRQLDSFVYRHLLIKLSAISFVVISEC